MAVVENNVVMEVQDKEGGIKRDFPITKVMNVLGITERILKDTTDLTDIEIALFKSIQLLAQNPYVIDDTTEKIYRIGINNGQLYTTEVVSGVDEVVETAKSALSDAKDKRDALTGEIVLEGNEGNYD